MSHDGCLACGLPTAQATHGAAHDLADVLCLACLVDALEAAPGPSVRVPPSVARTRCWGLRLTCPRPATRETVNGRYCETCAPPCRAAPGPTLPGRSAALLIDPVMASAVQNALALGTVIRESPPYGEPLEGSA